MKLAFGILSIIIGLWFIFGIFRGLRPSRTPFTHIRRRPHHLGDIINGILISTMFCGTGILLLLDSNLWWVFLPSCIILIFLWSQLYVRRMRKELEHRLKDLDKS